MQRSARAGSRDASEGANVSSPTPGRSSIARRPRWRAWLAVVLTLAMLITPTQIASSSAAAPTGTATDSSGASASAGTSIDGGDGGASMPVGTGRLDSTDDDFAACPPTPGLVVADEAGGEIRRAADLEDYFDGTVGPDRWTWGTWNGGAYNPTASGGLLYVGAQGGSAWLRSNQGFTQRTLSGRANFGPSPWQHFGWGGDGFGDSWAIVSTAEGTSMMYARTYDGRIEVRTPLASATLGVPHDYRIVWSPARVDYYVDGALAASHALAISSQMYPYASVNGGGRLDLDWLRIESYQAGTSAYLSCRKDVGSVGPWARLTWNSQV